MKPLLLILAVAAIIFGALLLIPELLRNTNVPGCPPSGFGISSCGSGIDEGTGGVK